MRSDRGPVHLVLHRLQHGLAANLLLATCLALPLAVPLLAERLFSGYRDDLVRRADAVPLLAGARGNRFDLTLAALWARRAPVDPVSAALWDELAAVPGVTAIPLHVQHEARGAPVVGTTPEWFGLHGLRPRDGTLPLLLGDCLLGAAVAARLDLGVGDTVFSDPDGLYDLTRAPALAMHVCGVLPRTGGPEDDVVYTGVDTCWLIDGWLHGHEDDDGARPEDVLGRAGGTTVYGGSLPTMQRVTDANRGSFHLHARRDELPLTAVAVVPRDARTGTILRTRTNAGDGPHRLLRPRAVVDELLEFVLRLKRVLDAVSALLAVGVLGTVALFATLTVRMRAGEARTLDRIGCPAHTVRLLYALEAGAVLVLAATLAGLALATLPALLPDLVRGF